MSIDDQDAGQANLYAPPSTRIDEPMALPDVSNAPFYVVSIPKMLFLYFITAGWYSLYWFWRHWHCYKTSTNANIWPVLRAFFAIFTVHTLSETITSRLSRLRIRHVWSPGLWATLYVLVAIEQPIAMFLLRLYVSETTAFVVNMIAVSLGALALAQAQRAANRACEDPAGVTNRRITPLNIVWMVIGVLLWLSAVRQMFPGLFA